MDLFEYRRLEQQEEHAPLAQRLRPKTFGEVLGQEELLQKGGLIDKALSSNTLPSMILYGPPGTGKTTLAQLISKSCNMNFFKVSAVAAGVKDLREVVESAREHLRMNRGRSVLFIDEIHRFSKSQQDFLLPYVEEGELVLLGATTENPFFSVNKALLSRMILVEVKPLHHDALEELLERCVDLYSKEHGVEIEIDPEAKEFLISRSGGDARRCINSFEVSALHAREGNSIHMTVENVRDNFMQAALNYDNDEEHYNTISAFIKSMRGSDVDATIFYLAKMLVAGEDPLFIARRMLIFASEDVGNADPMALSLASSTFYAATVLGMPEVRINLSQCAVYLASAPKSNASYVAIDRAMAFVRERGGLEVPLHLQDTHFRGAEKMGRGGYLYPHNEKKGYVAQQYLPDVIKDMKFYQSKPMGYEKKMEAFLSLLKEQNKDVDK